MRYAVWLAQLLLMAVDVVVACQLDVARTLGLSAEYQRGPWQEGESATLAVTFAAVHGVALAVSAVAGERTPPLRTPRWWFVQTGIALAAVAAASLVTFALSPYPFDPVLHAAVFVVVLGTYLGGTVVAWLSIRVPDDSGTRPAWRAADWLDGVRALGSVWPRSGLPTGRRLFASPGSESPVWVSSS